MTDPRSRMLATEQLGKTALRYKLLFTEPLVFVHNNECVVADGHVVDLFVEELAGIEQELNLVRHFCATTKDRVAAMCIKIHELIEFAPNIRLDDGVAMHKREAYRVFQQLTLDFASLQRLLESSS